MLRREFGGNYENVQIYEMLFLVSGLYEVVQVENDKVVDQETAQWNTGSPALYC